MSEEGCWFCLGVNLEFQKIVSYQNIIIFGRAKVYFFLTMGCRGPKNFLILQLDKISNSIPFFIGSSWAVELKYNINFLPHCVYVHNLQNLIDGMKVLIFLLRMHIRLLDNIQTIQYKTKIEKPRNLRKTTLIFNTTLYATFSV